ncbi:hypothetical protein E0Z10_g10708 [Xylaria hypoxylon]|uniref:Fungal N-terminal domain-containing protein n=1 Tax=Xylaria hypoxylon TaxID=37992 RepID=A0A4Z0YLK7_9PEZI|nr:hypothetical protein E0Z10_g10708 [Xylaria hypoxylon]
MAEPTATIDTIAAVSQLTGELVKLTTTLRHHLKVMRKTPDEVQCFLMEMSNFTGLLNFFTELADRPVQNMARKEQKKRERRVSEIQQQCTYVYGKMEYLVDRFAVLAKGNMTPLEGLLERIKYLLDKPDIKDLRLSLQAAALTVNCTSTLFLWEEATMKDDTRTVSLLEQLRNLLPMAKKASAELAEYQQKHGTRYESGVPDPDNAMLAASEESQRQIAHAIRPHSSSEAAKDRSSGQRRRERRRDSPIIERTSYPGEWSSPFGPNGTVADSVEDLPRRRLNRVSFKTSDYTIERRPNDRSTEIRPDSGTTKVTNSRGSQSPPIEPPNPTVDDASYIPEGGPGKTTGKGNQAEVKATSEAHSPIQPKPSREYYGLDISDPMKPRIHKASPDSNALRGPTPPPEPKKTVDNAGSSRKDGRFSPEEKIQYSLPAPTESEESEESVLSEHEIDHWSGTNLALPSSKSTSPSSGGPRSPEAKRRDSVAVRPAGKRRRKIADSSKGGLGVPEKQPQHQPEQEQRQQLGSVQGQQPPDVLDKRPKEERRRQSSSTMHESYVSDRDASSREERHNPSLSVPVAPLGGPSGRRRPRRPRPQTML